MNNGVISFRSLYHAWSGTVFANPAKLAGPIFDKELRISSRRRRSYALRVGYIVLLFFFILFAWYSMLTVRGSGSGVYQLSRLSEAGRQIATTIVWFQFIVAQVLAIVMLSSAISDEVIAGTLGVLMTTPISSFQIVTGKLLSKLLQLMLLLAISLPLLAIVRVFGGVPWDYVISGIFITITAAVFAGSLSLLLSMFYRHAYTVIIVAIAGYLITFSILSSILAFAGGLGRQAGPALLAFVNPFWIMVAITRELSRPGLQVVAWPIHCVVMLACSAVLLAVAARRVRKAGLGEVFRSKKERRLRRFLKRRGIDDTGKSVDRFTGFIRPVKGPPVVWKEMTKGLISRGRGDIVILLTFSAALIVMSTVVLFGRGPGILLGYSVSSCISLVVMVRLAVFAAGSIAAEKEARTWPILLTTPLDDREIVWGKAKAAFLRNMHLLLVYFALYCVSFLLNTHSFKMHQVTLYILISAASLTGSILFVLGSGCYFGVRLKTTTAAAASTIGLYFAATYLMCGIFSPLRVWLPRSVSRDNMFWIMNLFPIAMSLINAGIGVIFAQRAVHRLRRDIF